MNNHSRLVFLLGILISVVSLWVTLTYVDIHEIYTLLVHSHGLMAIPLIAAFSLYYWIKAIRWQQLLHPMTITKVATIFTPMMIGFFGNIVNTIIITTTTSNSLWVGFNCCITGHSFITSKHPILQNTINSPHAILPPNLLAFLTRCNLNRRYRLHKCEYRESVRL